MAPSIKPRTGQGENNGHGRKPNTRGDVERASWAESSATRTSPATPRPESPLSQRVQGQPSKFKSTLVTTFRKQVCPYCRHSPEKASHFHRRIVPQGMAQHYCDGNGARLLRERGVVFPAKTQRKPTKSHSFHIRPPGLNVATDD